MLHASLIKKTKTIHSYRQALGLARDENKKLLIFFSDKDCQWCRAMSEVIHSERIQAILSQFVFFEIRWQKNQYLCMKFNVTLYPLLKVIEVTEAQEIVTKSKSGFMTESDLEQWLTTT